MKTIFVPTDFSTNATNALKYANAFAQEMNCKIKLVTIYKPMVGSFNKTIVMASELDVKAINQDKKKLDRISKKYLTVPYSKMVTIGYPVDEIINETKKCKADFIIMGTHGASGLKRVLFGSNTSEVISKSNIPVLAIPQRYHFKKINKIVYATDFKNTMNELKQIIPIAKHLDASIEIFNLDYGWEDTTIKLQEFEKKIKALSYKKITIVEQKASLEKSMTKQIKNYLQKHKPEILVMFPEDRSWFDKIFIGSKTEDFSTYLKVPLLSIRKSGIKTE